MIKAICVKKGGNVTKAKCAKCPARIPNPKDPEKCLHVYFKEKEKGGKI